MIKDLEEISLSCLSSHEIPTQKKGRKEKKVRVEVEDEGGVMWTTV
jgi:hypothetical protein